MNRRAAPFLTVVALSFLSVLLASCSADTPTLTVRLYTALVAGPEFTTVETSVVQTIAPGIRRELLHTEARSRFGDDYSRGRQVATYEIAEGEYAVRVRLLRPTGELLVERVISLRLAGNTVLPVHITRDCVGVVCPAPGGSAELSTCFAGRCVDPRCSTEAREYCPSVAFCSAASECASPEACATAICQESVCVASPVPDACGSDQWCNPDNGAGCEPLSPTPGDAFPCGTICALTDEPCRFGYWVCNDDEEPRCVPLQNRPSGFVCGEGRTCDTVGACVTAPPPSPGLVVNPTTGLITNESGTTSSFTVALATEPTASVFVLVSSGDTSEGIVSPSVLVFTAATWSVPQSVTLTGVDDAIADGTQTYDVTVRVSASDDTDYSGVADVVVSAMNTDDETASVVVTPATGLVTTEGGATATFTVVLTAAPGADVTVGFTSDDTTEGTVAPARITFTAATWSVPRTVTVRGVNDAIADGPVDFHIVTSAATSTNPLYNALAVADVSVTNNDNDIAGVTIAPMSGLTTTEAGGTATFQVSLSSQPLADVSLSLSSSDTGEGTVAPTSLTFTSTNWNMLRTVTVTGVDDALIDGDVAYLIVTSSAASADTTYNGIDVADVSVTNSNDEIPGVDVFPYIGLQTTERGGSQVFGMHLYVAPSADVTLTLTSDDLTEGTVSPASVTFTTTNWAMPHYATITGVDDALFDGDILYHVVTGPAVSADPNYNGLSVIDVSITNLDVNTLLKPTNTDGGDQFGGALAISGDGTTLAVGALRESSHATGIDGDQADNSMGSAGAAYVYQRTATSWVQQAYVKASNTDADDLFGFSVSLSADGNTLAVGAPQEDSASRIIDAGQADNSASRAGAVYVYTRTGSTWTQQAYIKAANADADDIFGRTLVLSADGNTLGVTAPGESSDAVGVNGDAFNNLRYASGAAYVFTRSGATWSQQAYLKASNSDATDVLGTNIAISSDGNTLAVTCIGESSAAVGVNGNQSDNSAFQSGAAYVFVRAGVVWSQEAYIKASNSGTDDRFGYGLALSGDGNTLAVGASYEDSAATGIEGTQSDNSFVNAGALYVFTRAASVWAQQAYVKASNTNASDYFGGAVSLSSDGNTMYVGAVGEASMARGWNGDQTDNSQPLLGAGYLFNRAAGVWTQVGYSKSPKPVYPDGFAASLAMSSDASVIITGVPGQGSCDRIIDGPAFGYGCNNAGAVYVFYP